MYLLVCCLKTKTKNITIYKTIILPVVLYGCETWSLILRKEHRLRILRRIFGPKRDEVTGGWRKLHNQELHNLYSSPNITRMIKLRRMRWTGHVTRMGRKGMLIGYWWENQKERDHWEEQEVSGRTILKWILQIQDIRRYAWD
jgi:hypothetical protein